MSASITIFGGLFLFVLVSVVVAGYLLVIRPSAASADTPAPLIGDGPTGQGARAILVDTLQMVGQAMPARQSKADVARRRLAAAGYRWPSAHSAFVGLNTASTLILAGVLMVGATAASSSPKGILIAGLCGAAFGFMLPERLLQSRIRFRQRHLRSGLPAALDLIVLALEAGQSFDQALGAASLAIRTTYPDLAGELGLIQLKDEL